MANLSQIVQPSNVITADIPAELTNKTLTNPKLSLGGTNGTAGQVLVSQGAGLAPVWGNGTPGFLLMSQGVI